MSDLKIAKEEKIKEEVLTAAQQLFQRYGFQKTTMEDIARAMGRGKSTLYYYFKSKDEIYEAIIVKEAMDVISRVSAATAKVDTASEKLKVYLITTYTVIREKILLNDAVRVEMFQGDIPVVSSGSMASNLKRLNEITRQSIKNILMDGIQGGEFRESLIKELDAVAYVVMTSLVSVAFRLAQERTAEGARLTESEVLEALTDVLISGLRK